MCFYNEVKKKGGRGKKKEEEEEEGKKDIMCEGRRMDSHDEIPHLIKYTYFVVQFSQLENCFRGCCRMPAFHVKHSMCHWKLNFNSIQNTIYNARCQFHKVENQGILKTYHFLPIIFTIKQLKCWINNSIIGKQLTFTHTHTHTGSWRKKQWLIN